MSSQESRKVQFQILRVGTSPKSDEWPSFEAEMNNNLVLPHSQIRLRSMGTTQFDTGGASEREGTILCPARRHPHVLPRYLRPGLPPDGHLVFYTKVCLLYHLKSI